MEENKAWRAKWIWLPENVGSADASSHDIVYFRRSFHVPEGKACRLSIDVSADSRYRLLLNGESVSVGPCKGDGSAYFYETIDLSYRLRSGNNVLAAKVVHFPYVMNSRNAVSSPASVWRSDRGAFLLNGELEDSDGSVIEPLHTGSGSWLALRDRSVRYQKETFTLFVGGPETVDGALVPHGWERAGFDDGGWSAAETVSDTHDGMWGAQMPWQLTARTIPALYETERKFRRIMRSGVVRGGVETVRNEVNEEPFSGVGVDLSEYAVSAGETHWFELDAGALSTGYLQLRLAGGSGSEVRLLCSECYEYPSAPGGKRDKGIRDEWKEGKALYGPADIYAAAGTGVAGNPEYYEPFWFRGFRFVRLEVTAKSDPLTVIGLTYRDTGYPLEVTGHFACSDESFSPLWDISLNTLARCMHETYEDTPYYEQMQYTMDTRLQILYTYMVSCDDRLARKAIHDFHSSLLPCGLLQARYPSVIPQVITGFSFFWILMVHDHYIHFSDAALVARYRPTIDAILEWFARRVGADGLVGQLPESYWQMIDWVEEWKELYGAPPASRVGPLTVINLMYADALQKAADLNAYTGRGCVAAEYRERVARINAAVRASCYSSDRGLFRDGPSVQQYSQHPQIWAVVSGAVTGKEAEVLMRSMLADPGLPKASIAYVHFLFRALSQTGLYGQTASLWDIWREQVDLHLTAWVEDPVWQRSDCHGWGAAPLYEFPAEILGITPAEPGFARIAVAPRPGTLQWASGAVPTSAGMVYVSWRYDDNNAFCLQIDAPPGVPVTVSLPDGSVTELPEAVGSELKCIVNALN
ncbi:alpha-L-rhamnosidase C-terminal domain-containing protein [Paenibacillus montanisoli]|uniref:alpha-L-rhamnosidase-related protein n=1 Tax=Paenibacillus montanisoli TaxID=2081970 RepID=UPI001402689D|nr:alpha-L-rhamnosidase C-terminal domain-containing protein [Paenibacillus montanisoli]